MAKTYRPSDEYQKDFLDTFNRLCQTRNSWQVWADFIIMTACAIANRFEKPNEENEILKAREKEYKECLDRMGNNEDVSKLFAITVMALNSNPEQDFLGGLFMALNLGNHWKGQFFTPYNVCQLMSEITVCDKISEIEQKGWISISDCACGAGATLIAAANTLYNKHKVNYQTSALFVAQDVDRIAGLMCYIQLSLLGCAGYVIIANSITNPMCGDVLIPTQKESQEFWYMPMYYHEIWEWRRKFRLIDNIFNFKKESEE